MKRENKIEDAVETLLEELGLHGSIGTQVEMDLQEAISRVLGGLVNDDQTPKELLEAEIEYDRAALRSLRYGVANLQGQIQTVLRRLLDKRAKLHQMGLNE